MPIEQDELDLMAALQLAAWQTQERATAMAAGIDARVKAGAAVEIGTLAWDPIARMARTRKEKHG